MLSADEALAEIRRLYFRASKVTIQNDLARAVELLRSMSSEAQRERATVYMEGLTQMRSDWARAERRALGKKRASKIRPSKTRPNQE